MYLIYKKNSITNIVFFIALILYIPSIGLALVTNTITSTQISQRTQLQYVGIPSASMNFAASQQRNSQWCWAASIQMVLNYYQINIVQEQIVARTFGTDPYGQLPNWAGSLEVITENLNNWDIDNNGRAYTVTASLGVGVPAPNDLLQELYDGHPIIVAYHGASSKHAVVITGAGFIATQNGPSVQTIIVRDPFPTPQTIASQGRIEYPAFQFMQRVDNYWFIRVF